MSNSLRNEGAVERIAAHEEELRIEREEAAGITRLQPVNDD